MRPALAVLAAASLSVCLAAEKPKPAAPKKAEQVPGTYARIKTSKGELLVRLLSDEAPNTVANFVELAKGERPFKDKDGRWVARPFYNGLTFHRIEPDQLVQGGCPKGDGTSGPGYKFEDEISDKLKFDKPGLVAMANAGADTNGSQFFVTLAPAPQYNNRYSIFGEVVAGLDVAKAISQMPVRGAGGRSAIHLAKSPVVMKSVTIEEIKAEAKEGKK